MAVTATSKRTRRTQVLQKPRGLVHSRVEQVGPTHFGIVSVDCAKERFKWMLCDFYGNILVPPTETAHTRPDLEATIAQLRQAVAQYQLQDLLVAVERTGRYHHVPQRAFASAGFEVRVVHPFATKHFRQPSDPGLKTDDTDLAAIHRAAVNGFALTEPALDPSWQELKLLIRHRRDWVQKSATLCTQIRDHLDAAWPGYAACFERLWESGVAFHLLAAFESVTALQQAGRAGLNQTLRRDGVRFQQATLGTVLAWAERAAPGAVGANWHRHIALTLNADRLRKAQEIQALERELAGRLARTPYVLLLSCPGINIVSATDFAGEMGPITLYANARCITGRAGLYPSRYQSDRVDRANGPLVRRCNRRLRAVILGIADNLILCNHHFRALAAQWRVAGKDARHTHVKVAARFCRIAYQMVAGRQVFCHPCLQHRSHILDKLYAFHREHDTPAVQVLADAQAAVEQLPRAAYAEEAKPLAEELQRMEAGRRRGPQPLGEILPLVLARLGVDVLGSTESGEGPPR